MWNFMVEHFALQVSKQEYESYNDKQNMVTTRFSQIAA